MDTMPNGNREPYRLVPDYGPPSPLHTSDSEDTWNQKQRWRYLALRVIIQWRRFLRMARLRRWLEAQILRGH